MRILINDKMQFASGVPAEIKSPALADRYNASVTFTATFDDAETVNCIGIGYTDATEITIDDGITTPQIITLPVRTDITRKYNNGLYLLTEMTSDTYTITHNGNYIGRVGIGEYRTLGTAPSKEIGFYTTTESRETLSGQTIPGAGGYYGRRFVADVRYKFTEEIYNDLETAYQTQIQRSYPYFILLDDEQHKVPDTMLHFYAASDKPLSLLQSSSYKFLYSYKFNFEERF
jgi:hypothetical protein